MTIRYYKDYDDASWPQQHNKLVLDAVFTKAYSFFKMQPKNRREVNSQLANVGQCQGEHSVFGMEKYPGLVIRILLNIY